jgi:hypothetical protein
MARYPCCPPPQVVSTDAAFTAASLCIAYIFSYVGSPSCLGKVGYEKLSMYCSIINSFIVF